MEVRYKYNIREHVCDILEGGEDAFTRRDKIQYQPLTIIYICEITGIVIFVLKSNTHI